jgi:succinylarginine dihydrolase
LCSSWHRQPESRERLKLFDAMFAPLQSIAGMATEIHPALQPLVPLRDEGAANHMRLCDATGEVGLHLFVYGESERGPRPQRFLARQTLAASQAIARLHGLDPERTFFLQQNPAVIDAGAFHNDVIATSHNDVLLYHELAFVEAEAELERLERTYAALCGRPLNRICVRDSDLSVSEAVASYLFNSQLLSPHSAAADAPQMLLLCTQQCARMPRAGALIERIIADRDNSIEAVKFVTLDESMSNGGGPACLRLRMQLSVDAVARLAPESRWTPARDEALRRAIERHYPDRLAWTDLADVDALAQFAEAQAALAAILR